MTAPSPFVYWAQTAKYVTLKIDLKNATKPEVSVIKTNLKFASKGVGAHGESQYEFTLDLFSPIKPATFSSLLDEEMHREEPVHCYDTANNVFCKECAKKYKIDGPQVRVYEDRVEMHLPKVEEAWWPRLTAQPQKPAWLKINFDLWKSEDCESEEETRDVMKDYPGMYDKLHKEEMGYRKEDLKKVYLVMYNLFQFIGFMYVMAVMGVRYAKLEYESVATTYEHVGPAMKFLQLIMFLEVMHPMFGYTKGSPLMTFLQVGGRAFVLFAMIESEPRMHTKPVVFYLFLVWSLVEIVRYPYYIAQLYKKEIYILTWLRYTIWIPLYPLGILCESIVILRNMPYFEETNRFTISLPNEWNFAFHMPSFLRLYLLFLTLPGMYLVMSHMRKLRSKKLKPKVKITKCK